MSIRNPHVADRIFNTPLLMQPAKLDAIIGGLSSRFGITLDMPPTPEAYTTYTGEKRAPGYRTVNGVGVIDVFGALVHRSSMQADSTYLLGYQEVARMFETALADPEVGAIVLNLDSPGGEVGGVFDLAEQIYSARGIKPIHAIAGNLAASAAYLLASAAHEVSITQTGWAGSVGVVMRHVDWSAAMEMEGVKVTHIFAGDHKIDGNPYEPLPPAVRDHFQVEIDTLHGMFVGAVAKYRGLSVEHVRGTQAQTFMGDLAVNAQLADQVETPDQLISRLADQVRQTSTPRATAQTQKETAMSADKEKAVETPTAITQAAHEAALATARTAAAAEASQAERDRISAIVNHAEAEGRTAQALHIALKTDMDPDAAGSLLSTFGKVTEAAADQTGFAAAMSAIGNPDVKAGGETEQPEGEQATASWGKSITRVHGQRQH